MLAPDPAIAGTVRYFLERLKARGVGVASCSEFFDEESKKLLHRNHLFCMLRNDYIEDHPDGLRGAALQKELERCLQTMTRAANRIAANIPDSAILEEAEIDLKSRLKCEPRNP
jgi:hypothetical protein